ncbi:MAG: hypothetical protein OEZ54_00700 [Gemmatimonadota bacterium]|nr:hypothetical protein [Gemmatimonadota bacterium]
MHKDKELLHQLCEKLDAFEEAVKTHEHISIVDSEVAKRQTVDRARQNLIDFVLDRIENPGPVNA